MNKNLNRRQLKAGVTMVQFCEHYSFGYISMIGQII